MARQRLIRPEFFRHAELYDAEAASGLPLRLAFAGLWTVADRRGLFRWRPRELKVEIMPYDAVDFDAVMGALERAEFVRRYVVAGEVFGSIPTFSRHQVCHHREQADRRIPDVPETGYEPVPTPDKPGASPRPARGKPGASPTVTVTDTVTDTELRVAKQHGPTHPSAPSWPAAVAEALGMMGTVKPGRVGKALQEFVATSPEIAKHGTSILVQAAACYVRASLNLPPERARFTRHPQDFFASPGYWVEQVRPGGGAEQLDAEAGIRA